MAGMLEGLAASILSTYLGSWVEGLEKENFKIALTQGHVEIDNLKLRQGALDDLHLPLAINSGYLGKLQLEIPWKNLSTKPAIIRISHVYLVVGPMREIPKYDEKEENERAQAAKQKQLALHELLENENLEKEQAGFKGLIGGVGFGEKLISKVITNLQLFIDKIHVRYEDDISHPSNGFVCGVTLESLYAQSTDAQWKPAFLSGTSPLEHKIVQMTNLGIYWNSAARFLDRSNPTKLNQAMESMIFTDSGMAPEHHYILRPASATMKMVMNKQAAVITTMPQYFVNLMIENIVLEAEENQYREILSLVNRMRFYQRALKYRRFRPTVPLHEDRKAWWRYIVQAALWERHEKKKVFSFAHIKQANEDRRRYVNLYKVHLEHVASKKQLGAAETAEITALEQRLDYWRIVFYRSLAAKLVKKVKIIRQQKKEEKEKANPSAAPKEEQFGGFWKRLAVPFTPAVFTAEQEEEINVELTEKLWRDLYAAIADEDQLQHATMTSIKPIRQALVEMAIEHGSLQLKNATVQQGQQLDVFMNNNTFLLFNFNGLKLSLERSSTGSMHTTGNLAAISAFDFQTDKTCFTEILRPVLQGDDSLTPFRPRSGSTEKRTAGAPGLLNFVLDIKPDDNSDVDYRLHADCLMSLQFIVSEAIIERTVRFFKLPKEGVASGTEDLGTHVTGPQQTFKKQSYEENVSWLVQVQEKKNLDVRISALAPKIVIPQDFTDQDTSKLVIDLGKIDIKTKPVKPKASIGSSASTEKGTEELANLEEEDFYYGFDVSLLSLQAFVSLPCDDKSLPHHTVSLLEKFDVNAFVQLCKVPSFELTAVKINGALPHLQLSISSLGCRTLFQILNARFAAFLESPLMEEIRQGGGLFDSHSGNIDASTGSVDFSLEDPANEIIRHFLDRKIVEFQFVLNHLLLELLYEQGQDLAPLAQIKANRFVVNLTHRAYQLDLATSVGTLEVVDTFAGAGSKEHVHILSPASFLSSPSSGQTQSMIQLRLRQIPFGAPRFYLPSQGKPEQPLQQDIEAQMCDLQMICDVETVLGILRFVKHNVLSQFNFLALASELKKKAIIEQGGLAAQQMAVKESLRNSVGGAVGASPDLPPTQLDQHIRRVRLRLGAIQLTLMEKRKAVADVMLDKSAILLEIDQKQNLHLVAGVANAVRMSNARDSAEDLYFNAIFPEILTLKRDPSLVESPEDEKEGVTTQGNLIDLELYVLADRSKRKQFGYDLSLKLAVRSSATVFFYHPFVRGILSYMVGIKALLFSKEPSNHPTPATEEPLDELTQHVRLDIVVLGGADIYVPGPANTEPILHVRVSRLSINNKFTASKPDEPSEIFDNLAITLSDLDLSWRAASQLTTGEVSPSLVRKMPLALNISQPLLRTTLDYPQLDIEIKVPQSITLTATEKDVLNLFTILEDVVVSGVFGPTGIITQWAHLFEDKILKSDKPYIIKQLRLAFDKVDLSILLAERIPAVFRVQQASVMCAWKSDNSFLCDASTGSLLLWQRPMQTAGAIKKLLVVGQEFIGSPRTAEPSVKVHFVRNAGDVEQHMDQRIDITVRDVMLTAWAEEALRMAHALLPLWRPLQCIIDASGEGSTFVVDSLVLIVQIASLLVVVPKRKPSGASIADSNSKENGGVYVFAPDSARVALTRNFTGPEGKQIASEVLLVDVNNLCINRKDCYLEDEQSYASIPGVSVLPDPLNVGLKMLQSYEQSDRGAVLNLDISPSIRYLISLVDLRLLGGIVQEWQLAYAEQLLRHTTSASLSDPAESPMPMSVNINIKGDVRIIVPLFTAESNQVVDNEGLILSLSRTVVTLHVNGNGGRGVTGVAVKTGNVRLQDTGASYPSVTHWGDEMLSIRGESSVSLLITQDMDKALDQSQSLGKAQKAESQKRAEALGSAVLPQEQLVKVVVSSEVRLLFVQDFIVKLIQYYEETMNIVRTLLPVAQPTDSAQPPMLTRIWVEAPCARVLIPECHDPATRTIVVNTSILSVDNSFGVWTNPTQRGDCDLFERINVSARDIEILLLEAGKDSGECVCTAERLSFGLHQPFKSPRPPRPAPYPALQYIEVATPSVVLMGTPDVLNSVLTVISHNVTSMYNKETGLIAAFDRLYPLTYDPKSLAYAFDVRVMKLLIGNIIFKLTEQAAGSAIHMELQTAAVVCTWHSDLTLQCDVEASYIGLSHRTETISKYMIQAGKSREQRSIEGPTELKLQDRTETDATPTGPDVRVHFSKTIPGSLGNFRNQVDIVVMNMEVCAWVKEGVQLLVVSPIFFTFQEMVAGMGDSGVTDNLSVDIIAQNICIVAPILFDDVAEKNSNSAMISGFVSRPELVTLKLAQDYVNEVPAARRLQITTTSLGMSNCAIIQGGGSNRATIEDLRPLLEPINLSISMNSNKDLLDIMLDISEIEVAVSLQEALGLVHIIAQTISLMPSSPPDPDLAKKLQAGWTCPTCTFLNSLQAEQCRMCEGPKPRELPGDRRSQLMQSSGVIAETQRQELHMNGAGARAKVLYDIIARNDTMPLLELCLSDFNVEANDWSSGSVIGKVFVDSTLKINHFSDIREIWEPTIEPWRFQFVYNHSPITDLHKLMLVSTHKMEINVTTSLIRTADQLKDIVEENWETFESLQLAKGVRGVKMLPLEAQIATKKQDANLNAKHPIVRNETGEDLTYHITILDERIARIQRNKTSRKDTVGSKNTEWACKACTFVNQSSEQRCKMCGSGPSDEDFEVVSLEHDEERRDSKKNSWTSQTHLLKSGDEAVVPIPEEYTRAAVRTNYQNIILAVQIQGPYRSLNELPVNNLGTYLLDISPEGASTSDELVDIMYEVSYRKGVKLLSFKSSTELRNLTSVPLDILVVTHQTTRTLELPQLAPDVSYSLPLNLTTGGGQGGFMSVHPNADKGRWMYSQKQLHTGPPLASDPAVLVSKWNTNDPDKLPPFVIAANRTGYTRERAERTISRSRGVRNALSAQAKIKRAIELCPPLVIDNHLFCELQWAIVVATAQYVAFIKHLT
eukprot:TRINITY_DN6567_c0_g1_i3.p1 TRINITY_DN6567_c0_g1~~TRINITY_DN6567_c0_g1_i3.p1  ORF type:complete len:3001 (-),score=437.87 TRINITY_DN6567_c0_g1_i3:3806-12808(-)